MILDSVNLKTPKTILDSEMASKLKNIGTKKVSLFYLKDGFYPKKKNHGLSI